MLNEFGETQRKLLMELMNNKEGMTIDHIGKSLNISRTAVNQHINSLEKEGYLEKFTLSSSGGRPGRAYTLSNKGVHLFPKQYAWFSEILLRNLKDSLGSEGLERLLRKLGEQIAEQNASRLSGMNSAETLGEIALIMKELGYESRADSDSVIKACNCVYHDLASANPEVCSFDLALLSAMSGRKVEHIECMVRGGCMCRFRLKEKLKPSEKSDYTVLK